MDPRCTICNHPSLMEIDHRLMAGEPRRALAADFDLSPSALSRHLKHLRRALDASADESHQAHQAALLDKLDLQEVRLNRLFRQAENVHSLHVSLGCIQEIIRLLALQEKIRHSLARRSS
jgi:DNA-binding transcriptional ArsR family regulator